MRCFWEVRRMSVLTSTAGVDVTMSSMCGTAGLAVCCIHRMVTSVGHRLCRTLLTALTLVLLSLELASLWLTELRTIRNFKIFFSSLANCLTGVCDVLYLLFCRSVTDPRDGKRVALKKMPNVFQNLVSCKRVFRELKMLCFFKHDNVSKFKVILKSLRKLKCKMELSVTEVCFVTEYLKYFTVIRFSRNSGITVADTTKMKLSGV